MEALSRQGIEPIGNPLEELQRLAAEVVTVKDWLGRRVEVLEELRYRGVGGEQIRGELQAYGAAMDRAIRVLEAIARLNIDERLARVTEGQAELMVAVFERACAWLGIDGVVKDAVTACLVVLLRAADAAGASGMPSQPPADVAVEVGQARGLFESAPRLQMEVEQLTVELDAVKAQRDDLLDALRRNQSGPPLAIEAAKPQETFLGLPVDDAAEDTPPDAFVSPAPSEPRERAASQSFGVTWHSGDGWGA